MAAGWSGREDGGGSLTRSTSVVQAVFQGQAAGRCRVMRWADEASLAGTVISVRRRVAVVALARSGAARVPAVGVRLNAMTASTSQAALALNIPDGRCARAECLRSACGPAR